MPAGSVPLLHATLRALRHAGAVRGFATAMSRLRRDPAAWCGAGFVAEHPPFARPVCIPPVPVLGRASPSHLVTVGRIQPASWGRGGNLPKYPHRAQHRRWEPSANTGVLGLCFAVCNLHRSWAGRPRSEKAARWSREQRIPRGRARGAAVAAARQGVICILFFSLDPTKYSCLKL